MVPNVKSAGPVKLVMPRKFTDPRGVFLETYSERDFARVGITEHFVQDNRVSSYTGEHDPRPALPGTAAGASEAGELLARRHF